MPTYRFIERAHRFRVECVYACTKLILLIDADDADEAQHRAKFYQRGAILYRVLGQIA